MTVTPRLSVCPGTTTFPVMMPVELLVEDRDCIGLGQLDINKAKVEHAIRVSNILKIDFGFILLSFSLVELSKTLENPIDLFSISYLEPFQGVALLKRQQDCERGM